MVKFSKYEIFYKKNDFRWVIFIFFDYFRQWYKPNIDKQNGGFEVHIMFFNIKKES